MKLADLKPLITTPTRQSRDKRAAFLKEQIYGGVTIMAVNCGLLFQANLTVDRAYIIIVSTALGIWLASMFAAVMSHRIVHDKNMRRHELIHELTVHRGLLIAAVPSLIMLTFAAVNLIELRTAILTDITLGIISMSVGIIRSAKTATNSIQTALISIGLQAAVAAMVVFVLFGSK